jgi:hypothetical protein
MPRLVTAVLSLVVFLALAAGAHAADQVPLASHRALYRLRLETTRGGDVTSGTGTMSYEIIDACDGWAVHQKLDMQLTNRDGQDVAMSSDYTTWESKDGLRLRFRTRQLTDQNVTSEVAGEAHLDAPGGAGEADFTLPEASSKPLPARTLFPTAHTATIIQAAMAGKRFFTVPLFDGTSPDGAQDSSIVMAPWGSKPAAAPHGLADMASGRVRIAFFDRGTASQQSDYEVAMRYWANGVADDLSMDFGDFVMAGKLAEFRLLKPAC